MSGPHEPFRYRAAAATSGLATWSLVTGLLGCCGGVLPIVLGILALQSIQRSRGMEKGEGLAIAGICLGVIGVIISIIYAAVIISSGPRH